MMDMSSPREPVSSSTPGRSYIPQFYTSTKLTLMHRAIGHDPKVYENSREFKPERYKGDTLNVSNTELCAL